jgi:hypothetical protein
MLGRLPLPIRENQRRGSQLGGLGVIRPSGGANAGAGCWPSPEEHIPSGSDRVRVGLFAPAILPPYSRPHVELVRSCSHMQTSWRLLSSRRHRSVA